MNRDFTCPGCGSAFQAEVERRTVREVQCPYCLKVYGVEYETVGDDGATHTSTLRPDAVWQDGVPVTAHDVEFPIDTMKDPAYTGPGAGSWRDVTVTALDDRTVRFQLVNPIAGFLDAVTQPIAPAHLLEGIAPELLPADPFAEAECLSTMAYFSNTVHPTFAHFARPERYVASEAAQADAKETAKKNFFGLLGEIDGMLAGKNFIMG